CRGGRPPRRREWRTKGAIEAWSIHKWALCSSPEDRFESRQSRAQIQRRDIRQIWPQLIQTGLAMRQAIGIRKYSTCGPRQPSGRAFGPRATRPAARFGHGRCLWLQPYAQAPAFHLLDLERAGLAHQVAELGDAVGARIEVRREVGKPVAERAEPDPAVFAVH